MWKLFLILVFVAGTYVYCQVGTVSNVHLVDHRPYMISVLEQTVQEVEKREWCNMKLPDIVLDLDESVLGWNVSGTVTFTNGFVVSIQDVNILQSSVNQLWRYNSANNETTVEVRGTLWFHDLAIGYDVIANLTNGVHRYTGLYTHQQVQYLFTVFKNAHTDAMTVTVELTSLPKNDYRKMIFMPSDDLSLILTARYDKNSTFYGISDWGKHLFQPIAYELVTKEIEFPTICYNCPAT